MKWQVVYKSQYTGGYLIVVLEADTLSEVVERTNGRDVISITRIMDE
jgi:peptidoglycan hydrolase CwlO-like protein